jgi:hypothetical protein
MAIHTKENNIISVKWGTKYSSTDVNNLYKMVQKNLSVPFTFYCLTDDPSNLNSDIKPIQITEDLDGVWNKLYMFQYFTSGTNLYFDLDTIIQNNIDNILDLVSDKVTMVKCYWKDIKADKPQWIPTLRNSSVLLWNDDHSYIWKLFNEDPELNMVKYIGLDRWMEDHKIPVHYFPENLIYSRIYGAKLNQKEDYSDLIQRNSTFQEYAYHYPDYKICLFNGPVLHDHYKGFEKYLA